MEVFMSKGKWKNPRIDKKVQVGGKMNPELATWVSQNGGFSTVEKAVELYKKSIEDSVMNNINFKFAHLLSNTVYVLYTINAVEFFVKWENINSQGDVDDFDLSTSVICSNEIYADRIISAISNGESDDNDYLDLYLFIRDTFDKQDCQHLFNEAQDAS